VDAASQSERAWEKLAYFAGVTTEDGDLDSYAWFEQELKLTALKRDEANELVKNVCALVPLCTHCAWAWGWHRWHAAPTTRCVMVTAMTDNDN
jgi:hypothetical protein